MKHTDDEKGLLLGFPEYIDWKMQYLRKKQWRLGPRMPCRSIWMDASKILYCWGQTKSRSNGWRP